MKILKFKLLDEGRDGIVVEAKEYLAAGQFKIVDDVKRTRRINISDELKKEIDKLKYFFLNLTGHWISPYSKYYDKESFTLLKIEGSEPPKPQLLLKELWQKTFVTGAVASGNGFIITGMIETVENKKLGLATPFITEDDDIGFYTECMDVLEKIVVSISKYLRSQAIPIEDARKLIPQELLEGKTTDEVVQIVIDKLEDKGAIIMMSKEDALPEKTDEKKVEVHTNQANIDGDNVNAAEEITDDQIQKENIKKNPYGQPASEGEFKADLSQDTARPKGDAQSNQGDMSSLEYSDQVTGNIEDPDTEKPLDETEDNW